MVLKIVEYVHPLTMSGNVPFQACVSELSEETGACGQEPITKIKSRVHASRSAPATACARVAACTSSPSVRACMHATETVATIDRGIGDRAAC